MLQYENNRGEIRITGYTGKETRLEIPEMIEGYPVTEIGPYAFSRTALTHLSLPRSIRKIGRYAFYLCGDLRSLRFFSSIRDLGAGALSGCHRIERFLVEIVPGAPSCLRDFLSEISEEICVEYHDGDFFARLMFPEFYEEGVENTPAKIIESHTHGSGIHYRNCFLHREFQFQEYDRRFSMARHQESLAFNLELALGRLMYPYRLSDDAREQYLNYLREHLEPAIDLLTQKKETEKISFLMDITRDVRAAAPSFDL